MVTDRVVSGVFDTDTVGLAEGVTDGVTRGVRVNDFVA